ncbi:GNAT family N-acetyltransferase [Gordonia caeni]|uniref:GNAT family N-acetyltransferase n=1 Tax=Gordonia caeni TaxID=1007097 RepID=A0ABP7PKK9_9ACTN
MLLNTTRLRLRPVAAADLHHLSALDADPEVMRFVSGGQATSAATIADWVIPRMQTQQREHGTGMWVLSAISPPPGTAAGDGAFLGWVQLRTPRHSAAGELELSYRLHRWAWGHGYASEAAAALIAVMFTGTGATRIFAGTHVVHTASRRVMERLGMRLAADTDAAALSRPDAIVEYEILRDQWLATRGRGAVSRTA